MKKKVAVGMSGGVDSSVTALLLKKQGYDVVGLYMKNWDCNPQEYKDVVSVCEKLDIPYYTLNFEEEYIDNVFIKFLKMLDQGYNINPDVLCNRHIKFDVLFNAVKNLGIDYLATGHYCSHNGKNLVQPKDLSKDQTYFLYDINLDILPNVIFPLGSYLKSDVRKIAMEAGLITANKKDSTGICFIGNSNFQDFIKKYRKEKPGDIIFKDKVVGSHKGLHFYTLGQRRELGVTLGEKVFVIDKDLKNNTLILGTEDDSRRYTQSIIIMDKTGDFNGDCFIRVSNLGNLLSAKVDGDLITLKDPMKKVGLGQSVVFYKDGIILGGALIKNYK